MKKVFYLHYLSPFEVTDEDDYNYFSEGFLGQGDTYCLKLPKNKCSPSCDKCGYKCKWTWNYDYKTKNWDKYWFWFCQKCDMIKTLEKYNKEDWKTKEWSNNTSEPSYHHDVCHTCKYFMFHSLSWCHICGQPMSRHKMSWAEFKKNYPDYRQGY